MVPVVASLRDGTNKMMMTNSEVAAELLKQASRTVDEGATRNSNYGDIKHNMEIASEYANAMGTSKQISVTDSIHVMQGVKLARLRNQPTHHDSMVDLLGYYALEMAMVITANDNVDA